MLTIRVKDIHGLEEWDQRTTLLPPPYAGGMKRARAGFTVGDAEYDALEADVLLRGIHSDPGSLPDRSPPAWPDLDWDEVARGQQLFLTYLPNYQLSMTFVLMIGFSNYRASAVLAASGYAVSAKVTFERYLHTFFWIVDWLSHPLDDPTSMARQRTRQVRAMHAYARRKSMEKNLYPEEAGVPISQMDLTETLHAFTTLPWELMRNMGIDFTRAEKKAMVAAYRVIGWYLGIDDEYNTLESLASAEAAHDDIRGFTLSRLETIHETGILLQNMTAEAFGSHTPAGKTFWRALLAMMYHPATKRLMFGTSDRVRNLRLRAENPPGSVVAMLLMFFAFEQYVVARVPPLRWLRARMRARSTRLTLHVRNLHLHNKDEFNRMMAVFKRQSVVADSYAWPLFSYGCSVAVAMVPACAVYLLYRFAFASAADVAAGGMVINQ